MEELKSIIAEVKKICNEEKINVKGDTVLDCSTRIFISNNIARDRGGKSRDFSKKESPKMKDPDSPATEAQKYRLKKEGFKGSMDKITKREASMAIDELDKQKN